MIFHWFYLPPHGAATKKEFGGFVGSVGCSYDLRQPNAKSVGFVCDPLGCPPSDYYKTNES